jgi:ribonucleoside-diphosphate reductase alpha chain
VNPASLWLPIRREFGPAPSDVVVSLDPLGEEEVFDLTEPVTSHFVANGLVVHNCSEFVFLDDTACNLASVNLMKFRREDGSFDVEGYRHANRVFFLAQEILVSFASYPTERIARNSKTTGRWASATRTSERC